MKFNLVPLIAQAAHVTLVALVAPNAAAGEKVSAEPRIETESTRVLAYSGRSLPEGGFNPLVVDLSLAPIDAQQSLTQRLPALAGREGTITLEIRDVVPDEGPWLAIDGLHQRPFDLVDAGGVCFYAEPYFNESCDLMRESSRALCLALLRHRLGERFDAMPRWMQEGLALWATERDDPPLVPDYGHDLDANELVPELEDGAWRRTHRFRDRMALHFLVAKAGADAPDRLVGRIAAGADPHDALAETSGLSFAEFRDEARKFALAKLAAREEGPGRLLVEGYRALAEGDAMKALDLAQEVISNAERRFHPDALIIGARALVALDNPVDAMKPIDHFFHLVPGPTEFVHAIHGEEPLEIRPLLGRAWLERGRAHALAGDATAAAAAFDHVIAEFPNRPELSAALFAKADLALEGSDRTAAAAHLTRYLATFPDDARRDEVEKRLEQVQDED